EWAQTDGARMVLDRQVQLAWIGPYPAAEIPCCRQVRIQYKCPINIGCAVIKIANKPGERVPTPGQGDGVIFSQLHGVPSETCTFASFLRAVNHPSIELPPDVAPCCHAVDRSTPVIELNGLVEQAQRRIVREPRQLMDVCQSA